MVQINLTYKDSELFIKAITATINEARMYQENFELTIEDLIENCKGRIERNLDVIFYNEDNKQQEEVSDEKKRVTFMEVQSFEGCVSNKEKHEEIKKIALSIYKNLLGEIHRKSEDIIIEIIEKAEDTYFEIAWERAEKFYNFAKEKEREKEIKNEL